MQRKIENRYNQKKCMSTTTIVLRGHCEITLKFYLYYKPSRFMSFLTKLVRKIFSYDFYLIVYKTTSELSKINTRINGNNEFPPE